MNGSRSDSFAQELFGTLPSRYDVLAEALSFGQNRRWRAKLTERLTRGQPRRVLDVATGTAGVALAIARRTDARLVGLDVTPAMLREAQANLRGAGLMKCVQLVAGSAECLPFPSASTTGSATARINNLRPSMPMLLRFEAYPDRPSSWSATPWQY